jgi:hypothetical protein
MRQVWQMSATVSHGSPYILDAIRTRGSSGCKGLRPPFFPPIPEGVAALKERLPHAHDGHQQPRLQMLDRLRVVLCRWRGGAHPG